MKEKEYLGDGVYAQRDLQWGIWLTTEDGINVTNKIYLEPEVYARLKQFVEKEKV